MTKNDSGQPVEILLVEDNPGDVRLIREALKEGKVANVLHVACDGVEALKALRREAPYTEMPRIDLVLLDLNLPRMDGKEVLAAIRSDERLKRMPVVVLSTSKAEEDVMKAYELHANCYVTKPVGFDNFIKVIKTIEDFWLTVVKFPSHLQ